MADLRTASACSSPSPPLTIDVDPKYVVLLGAGQSILQLLNFSNVLMNSEEVSDGVVEASMGIGAGYAPTGVLQSPPCHPARPLITQG